jgi:hypothetical protein
MSTVPLTVFDTKPAAPLPIPTKKPPTPSSLAPSIGFVKTPETPLQILEPAFENPLTNPSPILTGLFYRSFSFFYSIYLSSKLKAKAPLLILFPIFETAPTGAITAFRMNDFEPSPKP